MDEDWRCRSGGIGIGVGIEIETCGRLVLSVVGLGLDRIDIDLTSIDWMGLPSALASTMAMVLVLKFPGAIQIRGIRIAIWTKGLDLSALDRDWLTLLLTVYLCMLFFIYDVVLPGSDSGSFYPLLRLARGPALIVA